jgi:hypothetical protein
MRSINANSIAPSARKWLTYSRYPRILHVFDLACNLINEHREVLSIVTQQIGNGPFNLVIENDVCFSEYLNIESPVTVARAQLHFGDLTINTADAKPWVPRPDWESLHTQKNEFLNQIISLQVTLSDAGGKPGNPLTATLPVTNYQSLVSDLCSALVTIDLSSALKIASKLTGLGAGLTPAGDDFILGAIYAAWIIHPPEIASVLAERITNAAAPLTTSLSAAWLRSAGSGEAGMLWHAFFESLLAGNQVEIQYQIARLLSVGASSGADALAGFTGTFSRWAELASSKIT